MSIGRNILLHMFGRPRGVLGWLGGVIMARANRRHAAWAVHLLDIKPDERALEIGFGPGVGIALLAEAARSVAGVDPSIEMLRLASRRNARAIKQGRIDLRHGSADRQPFTDASFDKALAVNSMQVWPDPLAGLHETRRVLRPGGRLALAFTVHSGQRRDGVSRLLSAAGSSDCRLVEAEQAFCVLADRR